MDMAFRIRSAVEEQAEHRVAIMNSGVKKVTRIRLCGIGLLLLAACGWLEPAGMDTVTDTNAPASRDTSYIPTDLYDALDHLEYLLPNEALTWIRDSTDSEDDMIRLHFGLGMWLRNNWGLWSGSRMSEYFNDIGIYHPDDMSGIILDSFWRRTHGRPIDLWTQVHYYQRYWRIHAPPDTLTFDGCQTEVILEGGVSVPTDSVHRFVHLGRCSYDSVWWAFERPRGWHQPDSNVVDDFLQIIHN